MQEKKKENKKKSRIEYKSWFILYDVEYKYIYKCYYS